jgi:hypothetical protein
MRDDGFFYDVLHLPEGETVPYEGAFDGGFDSAFRSRDLEPEVLEQLPDFKRRMEWFIDNRPDLIENVACMRSPGRGERRLMSVVTRDQLSRVMKVMLDENEFFSPHGIRAGLAVPP